MISNPRKPMKGMINELFSSLLLDIDQSCYTNCINFLCLKSGSSRKSSSDEELIIGIFISISESNDTFLKFELIPCKLTTDPILV